MRHSRHSAATTRRHIALLSTPISFSPLHSSIMNVFIPKGRRFAYVKRNGCFHSWILIRFLRYFIKILDPRKTSVIVPSRVDFFNYGNYTGTRIRKNLLDRYWHFFRSISIKDLGAQRFRCTSSSVFVTSQIIICPISDTETVTLGSCTSMAADR